MPTSPLTVKKSTQGAFLYKKYNSVPPASQDALDARATFCAASRRNRRKDTSASTLFVRRVVSLRVVRVQRRIGATNGQWGRRNGGRTTFSKPRLNLGTGFKHRLWVCPWCSSKFDDIYTCGH